MKKESTSPQSEKQMGVLREDTMNKLETPKPEGAYKPPPPPRPPRRRN